MESVAAVAEFKFGMDYIREHFGSNIPLGTQQVTHNLYRNNRERLVDLIIRCLDLSGRESVLDVGCGNGFILGEVVSRLKAGGAAVGLDVSDAMLDLARKNVARSLVPVQLVQGNANDLSRILNTQFDRVMANFIFHYIDDPDAMCRELASVVAPAGAVILSIEARGSMPEMYELHFEAMARTGFPSEFIARLPKGRRGKMVLDNTLETVSRHFEIVEEHPYLDSLEFTAPQPFMDFYAEGHRYCGARAMANGTIDDETFKALYGCVEKLVSAIIESDGKFILSKMNSVFVCRSPKNSN